MGWGSTERKLLIALALIFGAGLAWSSAGTSRDEAQPLPLLRIDANSAPVEVLGALPGLGPALSGRIVAAREASRFGSIDDLDRRVKGIGPAKVASIRPYLTFDPEPTTPTPTPSR